MRQVRFGPANKKQQGLEVSGNAPAHPGRVAPEAALSRPALGTLVVEAGLASAEQIRQAIDEGARSGERLGEIVVRRGWATEEAVAQLLAQQWQLRYRKADTILVDPMAIRRITVGEARRLRAVPVWFDAHGLVVAIEEPSKLLFEEAQEVLGDDVSYVIVARSTLDHLLNSRYLTSGMADEGRAPAPEESLPTDADVELEELSTALDSGDEKGLAHMEFIESLSDDDEELEDEPVVGQVEENSESHDFEELESVENERDDDSDPEFGNDGVFYLSDRDIDEEDASPAAEAAGPHGGLKSVKDEEANRATDEAADQGGDQDADVEAAIDSIALASAELRSVQPKIQSLGSKLRRVQSQLVEREAQIESLEASERRANDTIRKLEAELAHRQDLFESLQGLVGQLQQTLTTADKNDR